MNPGILWAMVRKNFSETLAGGWYMLALCFCLSVVDIWHPLPEGAWVTIAIVLVFVLVPQLTVLGFAGDMRKDYHKFLDYLPVQRSERWASRIIDSALTISMLSVLLFWNRALSVGLHPALLSGQTFVSPLQISLAAGALVFWLIASGAFLGFAVTGNVTFNFLLSYIPTGVLGGVLGWVIVNHEVIPLSTSVAPVLLVSGTVLLASSYVLFVLFPQHWSRPRRWLVGGLPILSLVVGISAMAIGHSAAKWKQWDPATRFAVITDARVLPACKDAPARILVEAVNLCSGMHELSLDPEGHRVDWLGRGIVRDYLGITQQSSSRLLFQKAHPFQVTHDPSTLVTMNRDGSSRTEFSVDARGTSLGNGSVISDASVSDDGRYLCWTQYAQRNDGAFVVADLAGRRLWQTDKRPTDAVFTSGSQLAIKLAEDSANDDPTTSPQGTRLLLMNCATLDITSVTLPGALLCLSPDATRAICLSRRLANDRILISVSRVDIPSMIETPLIREDELTSGELDRDTRFYDSYQLRIAGKGMQEGRSRLGLGDIEEPTLLFDDTMSRALWLRSTIAQTTITQSLILLNLADGTRTQLLSDDQLPVSPRLSSRATETSRIEVRGFTSDGRDVAYSIDDAVYLIRTSGGGTPVNVAPPIPRYIGDHATTGSGTIHGLYDSDGNPRQRTYRDTSAAILSPSRRRVMRYTSVTRIQRFDDTRSPLSLLTGLLTGGDLACGISVYDNGVARTVFVGKGTYRCQWIDDNRILATGRQSVLVVNADGGGNKQVFPPVR